MQLYGYGPFVEEPFDMPMPIVPDTFMGPEAFPFAPEMGDLGLYLDDDIDKLGEIYFNRMRSFGPDVTRRINESESEYESEDYAEDDEESEPE